LEVEDGGGGDKAEFPKSIPVEYFLVGDIDNELGLGLGGLEFKELPL